MLRCGCLVGLTLLLEVEGDKSFSNALVDTLKVLDVELLVADEVNRALPSDVTILLSLLAHHGGILSLGGGWLLVLDHLVLGLATLYLHLHLCLWVIFGRLFRWIIIFIQVGDNFMINCHIRFLVIVINVKA